MLQNQNHLSCSHSVHAPRLSLIFRASKLVRQTAAAEFWKRGVHHSWLFIKILEALSLEKDICILHMVYIQMYVNTHRLFNNSLA